MSSYVLVPGRESTLDEIKEYKEKLNKYLKEIDWKSYIEVYENKTNTLIKHKGITSDNLIDYIEKEPDGFSMFLIKILNKEVYKIIETFVTCKKIKIKGDIYYKYTPHDNCFWTYKNNETYGSKNNGEHISIKHVAAIIKYLQEKPGTN